MKAFELIPEYRLITCYQPYASLIALGIKRFETRSYSTNYRGLVFVHAGKKRIDENGKRLWMNVDYYLNDEKVGHYDDLPYGKILAVAELTGCYKIVEEKYYDDNNEIIAEQQTQLERCCGNWKPGWFAWKLENVHRRGKQKIWSKWDVELQKICCGINLKQ